MRARKSIEPGIVTSYRISESDKRLINMEHGSLANFFNKCVSREIRRIQKRKSVKPKKI